MADSQDVKRRRKGPPPGATPERNLYRRRSPSNEKDFLGAVGGDAPPLNAANLGNKLLQVGIVCIRIFFELNAGFIMFNW